MACFSYLEKAKRWPREVPQWIDFALRDAKVIHCSSLCAKQLVEASFPG